MPHFFQYDVFVVVPLKEEVIIQHLFFDTISDFEAEREEGQVPVPGPERGRRETGDAQGSSRRAGHEAEIDKQTRKKRKREEEEERVRDGGCYHTQKHAAAYFFILQDF